MLRQKCHNVFEKEVQFYLELMNNYDPSIYKMDHLPSIISIQKEESIDAFSVKYLMGLDKQNLERKIINIFLPISFSICFGCSKEPF